MNTKSNIDLQIKEKTRENLTLLYDFYIISKSKSLQSAAKNNSVSQSTLSRNLKALEANLNQKLVSRTSKGVELTEAGLILLEIISEIFEKIAQ